MPGDTSPFFVLGDPPRTNRPNQLESLALPERYIVSKCHRLVEKVTAGLEGYDLGDAGRNIYEFLWDEYADW